ncbi:protein NLRC3-like [Dysidea avara]|uniref:protein NLRC3-like n=1 Tax=Dysidea avara TaxID=196820 RepID=UPI00332F2F77
MDNKGRPPIQPNVQGVQKKSDNRPILRDLYDQVVPSIADKWKDLGVQLLDPSLIDQRVLEVIAADHPHSVEDCCKSVFEKWLNTQEDASWQQLLEALKSVQLDYLSSQIENKLKTGVITGISHQSHLSHHMRKYCQYLKGRYRSLELICIDEQLDCSSSKYVSLTLVKIDRQGRTTSTENRRGDSITLSEALGVEGEIKKVILIKGDPGMGKSTLAINICKCWAEGSLLQTYNAVILLTLRDPEIQAAKTITDLLLTVDEELKENVLKDIMSNFGEGVCFILEGYDELPQQLHRYSVFTKLRVQLPNCTIVYTSRPEACDKLESVASRIIKIEGFKENSIDEYISNTFDSVNNGANLVSQLKSQLHKNWIVRRILHIPINVAIVCVIFFHFSTLPETLTQLYTLLCLRLILRYITTRIANVDQVEELRSLDDLPEDIAKQFSQLCFIAYKGVESNKIIFSSHELRNIGIAQEKMSDLGLLVTAPSTSVYGREKSYNFLHKTLQEFSTAWYISKLSLQDHLKCINTYWNDDNYIMVWRFYSGITGLNNKEVLNCILPYKLVKSRLTERRIPHLMDCVYEAHNSELCHIVGDHLDGATEHDTAHVIDYFLTHYKGTMRQLHCGYSDDDDDDEFQLLVTSLQRRQSQHNNDNLILNIPDCRITHQSFSLLVQLMSTQYPIVELNINGIKVQSTSDMVSTGDYPNSNVTFTHMALSQVFTSSNTLSVLDINYTDIGPEGAAGFADLRNVLIRDLRMAVCSLGPTGADKVGEMLYHNNSIVSIDLSINYIEDSGVERLVYHLNKNNKLQHLNLRDNEITVVGANHLRRLIATDHPTLTSIELSDNPLEDEGVHVILSSLTVTMEHIGLRRVDMTASSCPIIGASLNKIKSISFDLRDDDYEVMSLANTTVLKQLELYIYSDSAIHKMLSAIRQRVGSRYH